MNRHSVRHSSSNLFPTNASSSLGLHLLYSHHQHQHQHQHYNNLLQNPQKCRKSGPDASIGPFLALNCNTKRKFSRVSLVIAFFVCLFPGCANNGVVCLQKNKKKRRMLAIERRERKEGKNSLSREKERGEKLGKRSYGK